ncbi:ribosomal protein S18 acetylase RimI-like enzyme [Trueperella bonasi]|uniref:Ribosomal protein S18 acetylase RimI-like enzyme n=1 Tax=Trueperella bonasi TaxID=312286 RepID=A0ABT9NEL9_9ACTO|nr:GNAT family N-acetyltransferase [Trueperella bonasi]MDP9805838.1 ribosomal protein S18 acetylase RimI-like enzyme [Trueperella bonasi]
MIELASSATPDLEEAFARLIPQLSSNSAPMDIEQIEEYLAQQAIDLILFRDEGEIQGMLTLVTFTIPTGTRAWIEDVVVDNAARGKGAGMQLVEAAIELAHSRGAHTVDLTSRPSREAANRLYQRAGFEKRETNVYRHAAER